MEKLKGLLKKEDVTNVLGVSENEVQEFINVGLLTALSMSSGQIYVPAECVNNLLNPTKKNSGYLSANTLSSTKGDGVMKKSVPNKNGWVQVKDGIFRKEVGKKDYVYKYRICQYDATGKKIDTARTLNDERKPFKTVREAEAHRNALVKELLGKAEKGSNPNSEMRTIEQLFNSYIETRSSELEPGTLSKHIGNVKNHLVPYFKDRDINDITVGEMKNFAIEKHKVLAYETVKGILQIARAIWKYGYEMGVVSKENYLTIFVDELTKVSIKRTPQEIATKNKPVETFKTYEMEEFNRLALEYGKIFFVLVQLCYYGGLRAAEAIGLRWKYVNFETGEIIIHSTVNYHKVEHYRYIGPTKNKCDRVFFAPPALIECLKEWKKEQEENTLLYGDDYKANEIYEDTVDGGKVCGGDFILRFPTGEHLTRQQADKFREWMQKKTGIHFYYHGLRKTLVSQLHGLGVPIKTISEYIGHLDMDVTIKYYLGNSQEGTEKLKDAIDLI